MRLPVGKERALAPILLALETPFPARRTGGLHCEKGGDEKMLAAIPGPAAKRGDRHADRRQPQTGHQRKRLYQISHKDRANNEVYPQRET